MARDEAWLSEVDDIYPLSPLQEGILFHTLYDPEARVYVEQMTSVVSGALDRSLFERAWQQLFDRHAALRTAFYWRDLEQPLQVVHHHVAAPIVFEDWREAAADQQRRRADAWLAADRARGFDLSVAPLARLAVAQTADATSRVTITFHHLILDGWSLQILNREFQQVYRALAAGEPLALPPTTPFRTFVDRIAERDANEASAFWRDALADCRSAKLDAAGPTRHGAVSGQSSAEWNGRISEEATRALQTLAQREQVTLHAVVCGAWSIVLARYTGSRDVVFGTVVSGRSEAIDGIESMVGLFINTVPVRVRVPAATTVTTWLDEIHDRAIAASPHQHVPLVTVRKAAAWPAGEELFDTILAFENFAGAPAAGADEAPFDVRHWSNYPLDVTVVPGASLGLVLAYDPDRIDRTRVEAIAADFCAVLEALPHAAERTISELEGSIAIAPPTVPPYEGITCDIDRQRPIHQLIATQAAATPDAIAVVFEGCAISYRMLDDWSSALAGRLRQAGVGVDARVGLCLERSIELVVSIVAVLKAGAAYLPLDPEYPRDRIAEITRDARVAHVLTQRRWLDGLNDLAAACTVVDDPLHDAAGDTISVVPAVDLTVDLTNACYVLYTSGSTGKPKGVVNCHAGLANRLQWMQAAYRLDAGDVVLQKTPFSFDVSVWEFLWPLMTGARLVVARPGGHRDPWYLGQLLGRESITTVHFVPSMLETFLEHADPAAGRSLRRVVCSGEALSGTLARRTLARWRAGLFNLYGPTEASIDVTAWTCREAVDDEREAAIIPIGRPIANTQMYVLDAERRLAPIGTAGELYIGGIGLARGYLGRPALTAERFVPHPCSDDPGARLYRTGDLARWRADLQLEFLGRTDHQVKIRGYRIELGEIEAVLREQPAVADAVVTVRESARGVRQLVAYIVGREGHADGPVSEKALRRALQVRLPDYMVPAVYVVLDALPLTAHGKLDRKALPAPVDDANDTTTTSRTPLEVLLAGIWTDVLGRREVGVDDNFFDLGGDSIVATRLMSRVNTALGLDLPLRVLFESPTIASLATAWSARQPNLPRAEIVRVPRSGGLPLSFAQQTMWLLQELDPEGWAYNVALPVRVKGALDRGALQSAVDAIVARHEILRTSIRLEAGQPRQTIRENVAVPVAFVDLVDDRAAEHRAAALVHAASQQPFDLSEPPLIRVTLVRLAEAQHMLLLMLHHIAVDAWSAGTLLAELVAAYDAIVDGRPVTLSEPPIQYADFAVWQRDLVESTALAPQLEYWRRTLDGAPPRLPLAVNLASRSSKAPDAATHRFTIPARLARRIDVVSRREGVTPFMVLLAALAALLRHACDEDDVVIGSPFAGRSRPELEGLMGSFVNTLPLRLKPTGRTTFAGLLREAREACLGAAANQDVPFDRLVEALAPRREVGSHPIYQAVFTFQNAPQTPAASAHLQLARFDTFVATAKFDLVLNVWKSGDAYAARVEYACDAFTADTISRLFDDDYLALVDACAADPEMALDEIDLLSASERRLVTRSTTVRELEEPILLGE